MSAGMPRADVDQPRQGFEAYTIESRRPLAVLAFLFPLVVFYEVAAVLVLDEDGGASLLTSRNLIHTLFEIFGVVGVHLPGVLLIATLVAQHLIARERWGLRPVVPAGMLAESCVWAIPILVLAGILGLVGLGGEAPPPVPASAIAVGAGVYEEFVFRLALIAAVHALLVDICGVRDTIGRWLAVAASVFAFASFHGIESGGGIDVTSAAFYGIAGLFLSWLFLTRGLGIAAGAHAAYDLLLLVVLPAIGPS